MRLDVTLRQRVFCSAQNHSLGAVGIAAAEPEEIHAEKHVAPACDVPRELRRNLAQKLCERIVARTRHHVSRRALQHRDMRRVLRHFRHQRHGGGTGADHDDALVFIVDVGRPFLRMDHLPFKILRARKGRRISVLVVVIAAAHEQKFAGHRDARASMLHLYGPLRLCRRP